MNLDCHTWTRRLIVETAASGDKEMDVALAAGVGIASRHSEAISMCAQCRDVSGIELPTNVCDVATYRIPSPSWKRPLSHRRVQQLLSYWHYFIRNHSGLLGSQRENRGLAALLGYPSTIL